MLCKKSNILKNSFLTLSLTYLLSATAFAQSPLDGADGGFLFDSNLSMSANENPQQSAEAPNQENGLVSAENNENSLMPQNGFDAQNMEPQQNEFIKTENNPMLINNAGNGNPLGLPEDKSGLDNQPKEMDDNAVLNAYNNFVEETDREAFNDKSNSTFGDTIMDQVKEDLFSQMADIEKQTSLLTLELKREKIKNEIAAMHEARQKAIEEEKEKQLEKERRQKEWEREQEKKLLAEKQKLKETEIKFEKLRQERVLKAYKENMLKTNQEWVDYNSRLYNQLVKEEKDQNTLIAKQKEYFGTLNGVISDLVTVAQKAKEKYNREIANLQTQVAILKSKLEAEKSAFEESKKAGPNPFALVDEDPNASKQKVSEEYAIMEISGKGENLIAKLINKSGGTFMVKPGTVLNTGHVIEEITQTYIVTDKGGVKDYLYFSAGGILDKEPTKTINATPKAGASSKDDSDGEVEMDVPGLREGMFVE